MSREEDNYPLERDDHHIIPTSRLLDKRGYRGKDGLNAPWNIRRVPRGKHRAYHYLFGNRTPHEVIRYLAGVKRRGGAHLVVRGETPRVEGSRIMAWIALFGDTWSLNHAISVVKKEWGLDKHGVMRWKFLLMEVKANGHSMTRFLARKKN